MRALLYHSAHDVRVETVPDPIIQEADDVILKVTATAICGSDLHLYRGKIPATRAGDILGHEFMGVVVETGPAVKRLKKGDRVVVPFVIACGQCFFCDQHLYAACETTNPDRGALMNAKGIRSGAAMFGYSHLYGGMPGGQAEYVRVPKADVGPICIDSPLADEQVLFLSDILPTGYQAVKNAGVREGSTIAIYGAGPVGQMAAASARMLGAEKIFMVDHHAYRLAYAEAQYNTISINFEDVDPAEVIIQNTSYRGVDAVIDAVGAGNFGVARRDDGKLRAGVRGDAIQQVGELTELQLRAVRLYGHDERNGGVHAKQCPHDAGHYSRTVIRQSTAR